VRREIQANAVERRRSIEVPDITMLVLSYNQCQFIEQAVEAAVAQQGVRHEVVVVDDGSTDGTQEVLARLRERAFSVPVKFLAKPANRGLGDSINSGMRESRGDVVVACAADDISMPNRARELLMALSMNDADLAYSNARIIDSIGRDVGRYYAPLPRPPSLQEVLFNERAVLGAVTAWRRVLFEFFDDLPSDLLREDLVIPMRAALLGGMVSVDKDLVAYRMHGNNAHFHVQTGRLGGAHYLSNALKDYRRLRVVAKARANDIARARQAGILSAAAGDFAEQYVTRRCRELDAHVGLLSATRMKRLPHARAAVQARTSWRRCMAALATGLAPATFEVVARLAVARGKARGQGDNLTAGS
jgi:glycosyltransferase involved in cell wall biosynthesis